MSSCSSELIPIPAYRMLQTLYRPEEAARIAANMTPEERESTIKLMNLIHERELKLQDIVSPTTLDALDDRLLRQHNVLVEDMSLITPNIIRYCQCLGYDPLAIMEPGVDSKPKFLVSW